jgi:carbon monoxide dehydrogenase subunit G
MQADGRFQVGAAPAQVFAFFSDPRQLLDCLDDPHTVDSIEADGFTGTITTGVAFIRGTFRFTGRYEERTPGQHVKARIRGSCLGSAVDAVLLADFGPADSGTAVVWRADIVLTGPVASIGERLVRSTIDKKTTALFERARQRLETAPRP